MVLTASDTVVPVSPENVPDVLKQARRWLCWKREATKNGTFTKKPMQALKPRMGASKTTPRHWTDFAAAVKAHEENEHLDGIGFVCGGGIVALDYDECCDETTRELRPDVQAAVARLNTYAEYSPSGRGVRVFLLGELPGDNVTAKAAGVELYGDGAYVTVTGFRVPGTPEQVADGGELLAELYDNAKASQAASKAARQGERKAMKPVANASTAVTAGRGVSGELDVLAVAKASSQGAEIERLMAGQWNGYPTQSEAELALANYLAFYAGPGGAATVERVMRGSGLARDKWNESRGGGRTYLSLTIDKAYENKTEFYSAAHKSKPVALSLPNGMASAGPVNLSDSSTLTDVGLARRLVLDARGTLRYCREWRAWLSFTGRHWQKDDGLVAAHVAKKVSDKLWSELADVPGDKRTRELLNFVKNASSSSGINAAVSLARSEPGVVVSVAELDVPAYVLNVANGTLNLDTAELHPHAPGDLLTHMAGTAFDAAASCPNWKKFVAEVTNGNKELAAFLQRSCGLALSADVSEHALWLHYGEGRNGKSTLLNIMLELLGTYAGPAPMDLLLVKNNRSKEVETQFATLAGKRLVTTVEADSGVRFSEATVKLLTGGDVVKARNLYESPWDVRPTWKLHVAANHKPVVRGTDEGIWRRLLLTPWAVRFDGAKEDKRLREKLRAELPGILNWCLAGFVQWRGGGLNAPADVLAATQEYRGENDVLGTWLTECCIIQRDTVAEAGALYRSFKTWAEDRGEFVPTATAFGLQLERLGYVGERPTGGTYRGKTIRRGIGLLDGRRDGE
jgi:putative DNA primase/helicase